MKEYELLNQEIDIMLSEIEDIHLIDSTLEVEEEFIPIDLSL